MSQIPELKNLLTTNSTFGPLDWEDAFLGAIVGGKTDGDELIKAKKEWFFQKETQMLFDILSSLKLDGIADYISVHNHLAKYVGGNSARIYLEKIIAKVPEEYNPLVATGLLEELYVQRETNKILADVGKLINQTPLSGPQLLYQAYEKIDRLVNASSDFDWGDELEKVIGDLKSGLGPKMLIPTGIKAFDDVAGGISTQEVTVIGARPSHGKTTSLISLSRSILDTNPNEVVSIYELEMATPALMHKFVASEAKIDHLLMRQGKLSDEQKVTIGTSTDKLKSYDKRLFIYDNVYDLATMNKLNKATNTTIAFVDFITLMDGMTEQFMRLELGRLLINAKRYAKLHNIAYVFYSQLNRSVEARETKRPQTSDLAESDMISQLAGDIILLHYAYKYTQNPIDKFKLKLIFDKTRYASVADRTLKFFPQFAILTDI